MCRRNSAKIIQIVKKAGKKRIFKKVKLKLHLVPQKGFAGPSPSNNGFPQQPISPAFPNMFVFFARLSG